LKKSGEDLNMIKKIITNKILLVTILFSILSINTFGQTEDIVHGNIIQFNDNGAWCWYQDERSVIDTSGGELVVGSVASDSGCGNAPRSGDIE
jgi:hypothetical protein